MLQPGSCCHPAVLVIPIRSPVCAPSRIDPEPVPARYPMHSQCTAHLPPCRKFFIQRAFALSLAANPFALCSSCRLDGGASPGSGAVVLLAAGFGQTPASAPGSVRLEVSGMDGYRWFAVKLTNSGAEVCSLANFRCTPRNSYRASASPVRYRVRRIRLPGEFAFPENSPSMCGGAQSPAQERWIMQSPLSG